MLGTFPFELWFKSYHWFYSLVPGTFGNCKIALIPFFPSLLCFPSPATDSAAVERLPGFPGHYSAVRWRPRVADDLLPLLLLRAGASRPSHAPRRFQNRPAGRHLAAAVESPNQRPSSRSFARLSTTRSPARYSSPFFASTLTPRPRTPQPLTPNPDELHPAAEPPPQARSNPTAPTFSRASSSRNSQAISPRPNLTGATPPPCSESASRRSPSTPHLRPP